MMKLPWTCWVPGQVLARAEKHVTLHSKDGKSFVGRADCKPQADYKSYLRWSFAQVAPDELLDGPLSLQIIVVRQKPKSARKSDEWATTKPDSSNYQKLVEDCLSGIVIVDDARLVDVQTSKLYGTEPGLGLWIQRPSGLLCGACLARVRSIQHRQTPEEGER